MKGKVIATKIEKVIKDVQEAKPHLFDDWGQPLSMEWELLREVRWQAIDAGLRPQKILQVMGFEKLEYERIIF